MYLGNLSETPPNTFQILEKQHSLVGRRSDGDSGKRHGPSELGRGGGIPSFI